ncbi:MAG TPA: hypothetical protein VIM53_04560 [Candidatus Saccharimonadales bacterium]
MIRRARTLGLTVILGVVLAAGSILPASAAFNPDLVMDDTVFNLSTSMSAAQIDSFLNGFPSSCISSNNGFSAPDPTGYSPSGGYTYGGNVTAGQVIYDTAQAYQINPQVLLATVQKEQSLVTGGGGCSTESYVAAMGYGCPDSGGDSSYTGIDLYTLRGITYTSTGSTCVNAIARAGFSQQMIHAAWLLKYSEERAEGNTTWAIIQGSWNNSDDLTSCYAGPMTQGTWARCPNGSKIYYDGSYTTLDGTSITIDSGATAALYWYTPHVSGNQSFYNLFTSWFGGTISANYYQCHYATNVSGAATGEEIVANRLHPGWPDDLSLVVPNNTGSACVEVHTWMDSSLQPWIQHTATNLPAQNPADTQVISADLTGSGQDQLYVIAYNHTSSGMLEVHGWDPTDQQWTSHVATNLPEIDPSTATVIAADPTGSGRDSLFLVKYLNTAGQIEIHEWTPDLQHWAAHIATNLPAQAPTDVQVIAGDFYGNGKDEFAYVKYDNTGSGRMEVHIWTPDFQNWIAHIATNAPWADHSTTDVVAADLTNSGRDQLYFVKFSGTGSGMTEVHGWTPDLQNWASHIATSAPEFPN